MAGEEERGKGPGPGGATEPEEDVPERDPVDVRPGDGDPQRPHEEEGPRTSRARVRVPGDAEYYAGWEMFGPGGPTEGRSTGLSLNARSLRKFVWGLLILVVILAIPTPVGLSFAAQATIALFAFLVFLWITEALPLPVTALMAGVGLVLLGVKASSSAAFMLYAQDTFFFILGSLIIADGVAKSGADRHIATMIVGRFGGNTWSLLFAFIFVCAVLAMFITEHAIAAVMIPIALTVLRATDARNVPRYGAALIIGIAFGCNIAGLATPSGGARNAIALGYMKEIHGVNVSYLDWMQHGVPITLVLIPFVFFIVVGMLRIPIRKLERAELGKEPWTGNQKAALGVLALTVVLWIMLGEDYGLGLIAVVGTVLMFLTGVLDWEDTRKTIPWGVAFVYGAALAMGQALSETGAARFMAVEILDIIPATEAVLLLVGIVVLVVVMTNFMSDGATVAVIAPVTLGIAAILGETAALEANLSIATVGILTAAASAFAFVLVIGTPPNLIAYATGQVDPKTFAKIGVPMTLVSMTVLILAALFYWPHL